MKPGDIVEDFTLPDHTGQPRSLSEFLAEGPVVLFFYPAAMTTGCTAESCHFRDLAAEFAEVGAQRVGISRDPVEKQARFAEQNAFDYPLLSDVDFSAFSHSALVRIADEVCLQMHLLDLGFRYGLSRRLPSEEVDEGLNLLRNLAASLPY